MTICIQCAMSAMVRGEELPCFDETPEAHAARVHPNQEETQRERVVLEQQLQQRIQDEEHAKGRRR